MGKSATKILEYYLEIERQKREKSYDCFTWDEKDEFRLEHDKDAKYYYEKLKQLPEWSTKSEEVLKKTSLKADTIVSFWTIYCRLLEIEAEWVIYNNAKTEKTLTSLIAQIETDRPNDFTPKLRALNKRIDPFARVCYTKGNFMLLPERKMNVQRYRFAEDRMDLTLYECFGKGPLAKFFTDIKIEDWIKDQKLQDMFIDDEISSDKINWLVKENKPKLISEMKKEELDEYLENATKFINNRNNRL